MPDVKEFLLEPKMRYRSVGEAKVLAAVMSREGYQVAIFHHSQNNWVKRDSRFCIGICDLAGSLLHM